MLFAVLVVSSLGAFSQVAKTERADYFVVHAGMTIDVRSCEEFLVKTELLLDAHVPHFTYYRVQLGDEVRQYGGRYADGLADPELMRIIAVEKCSKHEIVHLVAFQLGWPNLFWHEGIATTLAGDYSWLTRWRTRRALRKSGITVSQAIAIIDEVERDVTGSDPRVRLAYRTAHAFTHFLIQKYGMWRLRIFFRACSSEGDTAEAFHTAYGITQNEAWLLWLN